MESFWIAACLVIATLGIFQAVLLGLQTWEHRRFARSRLRQLEKIQPAGRAMVCAPCKGCDVSLEQNLRPLFHQDHGNYQLAFIVQSETDPACETIRRLMAEYPHLPTRLVVAGHAHQSGQKVHNLRAATADLPPDVDYLVFVDSDAQPRPEWLRALLGRLAKDTSLSAVTGYRWMVPQRTSLANHLLSAINSRVALLFASRSWYPVWGGSWAIRRDVFDSVGLRDAWQGTLSDDLVATRVLRANANRVGFEPAGMIASPLDSSLPEVFSFLRRQYLIGRTYTPSYWALGFLVATLSNLVLWANVGAILWALITGAFSVWIPAGVCALLYGMGVFRGTIRQDMVRVYFPHLKNQLRRARRFDIWFEPLVALCNWAGMLASLFGHEITWRGITYRLFTGGRIQIVARREEPAPPEPIAEPAEAIRCILPSPGHHEVVGGRGAPFDLPSPACGRGVGGEGRTTTHRRAG